MWAGAVVFYGGQGAAAAAAVQPVKTDHDTLRETYRFLREDKDERSLKGWESALAKRYYDKLFKVRGGELRDEGGCERVRLRGTNQGLGEGLRRWSVSTPQLEVPARGHLSSRFWQLHSSSSSSS